MSNVCRNRNPSSFNRPEPINVQKVLAVSSNAADDKYCKDVEIYNNTLKSYIDFGSDCSLIQHKVALDLNITKCFTDLPIIKGFGNSYVKPLFKFKAHVKIEDVQSIIDLYVVDD